MRERRARAEASESERQGKMRNRRRTSRVAGWGTRCSTVISAVMPFSEETLIQPICKLTYSTHLFELQIVTRINAAFSSRGWRLEEEVCRPKNTGAPPHHLGRKMLPWDASSNPQSLGLCCNCFPHRKHSGGMRGRGDSVLSLLLGASLKVICTSVWEQNCLSDAKFITD